MTAPAAAGARPGSPGLWPWAAFSGVVAAAGLPIYIHAPAHYAAAHGVSLAALGAVLGALRLLDVVQDPVLGWLAARGAARRGLWVALAAVAAAAAMVGLFLPALPAPPLVWFALTLTALFSAHGFLTIVFYAQGVQRAAGLGPDGHLRLAAWREGGALAGVCLAAVLPTALAGVTGAPLAAMALILALALPAVVLPMRGQWQAAAPAPGRALAGFARVLADRPARRLLLIALVNAAPVAVTSTLFLFFVEARLQAPAAAGPLLLLFFASAGAAVPLWGRLAARHGARRALLAAMGLAVAAFVGAAQLGPGGVTAFAVICAASGIAMAADVTILPALFSRRLAHLGPDAAQGFGLWNFVSRVTLALAAVTLLPWLEARGLVAGGPNEATALAALTRAYAVLPCLLKLVAIALLAATSPEES